MAQKVILLAIPLGYIDTKDLLHKTHLVPGLW